ncbi:hypothetical protein AMJ49_00325 [Parcubacteria bacterium DG_74_2]|nr:MAG: hypothetical protein AMJ49_00325 [Parcubacteria bacterium DG_74_2]
MPEEYPLEQTWKLYEKLPPELKEAIFSESTAEDIWNICTGNEVAGDKISEIARYTGWVLLGLLPPDELQVTLEKELNLESEIAKKIAREINRYIFFPVKASLEELYKIEITPAGPRTAPPTEAKPTPKPKEKISKEEKPSVTDIYREAVE